MLQGGLSRPALVAIALTLVACAGIDGSDRGVIRENVIEPGITAIDDSKQLACGADASALQTALEIYETMEGSPAPDEATLVAAGRLRAESELWDVVDGVLVATDEACGPVAPAEATEIVTSSVPASADDVYTGFSAAQIEALGGEACARELAAIFAAGENLVDTSGDEPETIDDLVAAGLLERPPELWQIVGDALAPVDGSGCRLDAG